MVVVRCWILCSKFGKNRLSAGLCPDPLGEFTTLHRPPSWIMGEGRGKGHSPRPLVGSWGREWKGEMEGQEGGKGGKEGAVEKDG